MYFRLAKSGGRKMKIKILKQIPVQAQFRPTVSKIYDVVEQKAMSGGNVAFIKVNGDKLGVFTDAKYGECEVIVDD